MFETDFPHPTCLYPDTSGAREAIAHLDPVVQKKILRDNAASLYKIEL